MITQPIRARSLKYVTTLCANEHSQSVRKLIFANYRRNCYEKLWFPEFLYLRLNTTLQQAIAEKANLNALVLP